MKPKLSTLKKKCWKIFSEYIRRKYANKRGYAVCVTCGVKKHWKELQAGHFIDGRTNAILFNEECVHPQCVKCNIYLSGNKVEYFRFMQKKYGDETIDRLRKIARWSVKFYPHELEEKIKEYKQKLEAL